MNEDIVSIKTEIPDKEVEKLLPNSDGTAETYHRVLAKTSVRWANEQDVDVWAGYLIVQCRGNKEVSFCRVTKCSEDIEYDREGQPYLNEYLDVYPKLRLGRTHIARDDLLPELVSEIYDETLSAFQNDISV